MVWKKIEQQKIEANAEIEAVYSRLDLQILY